jgi:hypothetical protein
MLKIFVILLSTFIFQASVHAADKIRIAYSAGASSFFFLLAHKKGFLKAEGIDAEVIRMTGECPSCSAGQRRNRLPHCRRHISSSRDPGTAAQSRCRLWGGRLDGAGQPCQY